MSFNEWNSFGILITSQDIAAERASWRKVSATHKRHLLIAQRIFILQTSHKFENSFSSGVSIITTHIAYNNIYM